MEGSAGAGRARREAWGEIAEGLAPEALPLDPVVALVRERTEINRGVADARSALRDARLSLARASSRSVRSTGSDLAARWVECVDELAALLELLCARLLGPEEPT